MYGKIGTWAALLSVQGRTRARRGRTSFVVAGNRQLQGYPPVGRFTSQNAEKGNLGGYCRWHVGYYFLRGYENAGSERRFSVDPIKARKIVGRRCRSLGQDERPPDDLPPVRLDARPAR